MPASEGANRPLGNFTVKTFLDCTTHQLTMEAHGTSSIVLQQELEGKLTPVMPANFILATSMDSSSYDLNTAILGTEANDAFEKTTGYQYQLNSSEQLFPESEACSQFQPLIL